MEQIKLTKTKILSLVGRAVSGSLDNLASVPTYIDERLIIDEVLGIR